MVKMDLFIVVCPFATGCKWLIVSTVLLFSRLLIIQAITTATSIKPLVIIAAKFLISELELMNFTNCLASIQMFESGFF